MTLSLFAASAPGLEHLLSDEIAALGLSQIAVVAGGVEITAGPDAALRLLLRLRTASQLLVRVARFRADGFERFEREVRKIDWRVWLVPGVPRRVRATAEKSRLHHTGAITERLERFVAEQLGDATETVATDGDETSSVTIAARFVRDTCTLSIDLSGEPLHRRGYRLDPGRAPLREDLAAALVLASGWDASRPLIDPMCGAGTIAIEAACIATRRAPGLGRAFAIESTPLVTAEAVARERDAARAEITPAPAPIHASDRDPRAIARTQENATRAGVESVITVTHVAMSELDVSTLRGAAIVTNPPWGERLDEGPGLERLYAALGAMSKRIPGATLAFAAHDRALAQKTGLALRSAFFTDAGGTKVAAMVQEERRRR